MKLSYREVLEIDLNLRKTAHAHMVSARLDRITDIIEESNMKTWADEVAEMSAERERERIARQMIEQDKSTLRRLPMKERVARIIRDLPPDQRAGPYPLAFFVERLKPKFAGDRAAARDVARGLRELGWTRTRCWRRDGPDETGFRAVWSAQEGQR